MALSVIFTHKFSDAVNLKLNLNEELKSWDVICPNPAIADAVRLSVERYDGPHEFKTFTVSKFLKDIYSAMFEDGKVKRKADLLKYLAATWKINNAKEEPSYFHQAFEVFTDLRSFTLDSNLIESLLEHYHDVVRAAVIDFWNITLSQGLVDEHQAYQNIIDELYDPHFDQYEELFPNGIIFLGFTHLSANQIELLKCIGRFIDVVIPIPAEVAVQSLSTDWVDWVKSHADHIESHDPNVEFGELKLSLFSRGQGNRLTKKAFKELGMGNIIYPKGSISLKEVLQVPSREHYFKSENDLFHSIMSEYQGTIEDTYFTTIEDQVESSEVLEYINNEVEEILKGDKDLSSFLRLKLLKIIKDEVVTWVDLTVENEYLGLFDFSIIFEMVGLNLPRTFNIPILRKCDYSVLGLKELYQINHDQLNYIYCDSNHDLSMGGATNYSKEVQEILVSLGPIRRKGLDLLFYVGQLKEVLSHENSYLLMESGLEEHDPTWYYLLNQFDKRYIDIEIDEVIEKKEAEFTPPESERANVSNISASRMQTYMKCPRRYLYQYVYGLGSEPDSVETMDYSKLGDLEHRIVQTYLAKEMEWDEDRFEKYLQELISTLPQNLLENKLLIDQTTAEVRFFGKQTTKEFLKIKELDPDAKFEFERRMEAEGGTGSADVVIESKKLGLMLFDLKRSGGSIPSKTSVEKIETIQLWYYLNYAFKNRLIQEYTIFGYVNLSEPTSSLLFINDEDTHLKLKDATFLEGASFNQLKEPIDSYTEEFQSLHNEITECINVKKEFPINPKKDGCSYCPGAQICSRKVEA